MNLYEQHPELFTFTTSQNISYAKSIPQSLTPSFYRLERLRIEGLVCTQQRLPVIRTFKDVTALYCHASSTDQVLISSSGHSLPEVIEEFERRFHLDAVIASNPGRLHLPDHLVYLVGDEPLMRLSRDDQGFLMRVQRSLGRPQVHLPTHLLP